jgi:hypothetical protein
MDEPLIDPDCRDGKHGSCLGGPCECSCHRESTGEAVHRIIGEACGYVSLCWEPRPEGVFDSSLASKQVQEATVAVLDLIAEEMDVAFGVIANAHGGDWEQGSAEWHAAAIRFRDRYHAVLDARRDAQAVADA